MNVTIENIGPCKRLVRVDAEVNEVEAVFETVTRDFLKHASLPGFRPGKAPRDMVIRRFQKEIAEEAENQLVRDLYKAAIEKEKLKIFDLLNVEKIQFGRGQAAQVAYTVEVHPEFELPQYKEVPVTVETRTVSEADVDKALEDLRRSRTTYNKVDRAATEQDILVINFAGTLEGEPLTQKLGAAVKALEQGKNYWIGRERAFFPGAFEQLVGAAAGEQRTIQVAFPEDFSVKEVAGRTVQYAVEVLEVKEAVLPALDDAFAQSFEAKEVADLRNGVRRDLENEVNFQRRKSIRNQITDKLLQQASFEIPASVEGEETRALVYNMVADLQRRGVQPAEIEAQKDHIYQHARVVAASRVRLDFLLGRMAEVENIAVTNEELAMRLSVLAYQRQVPAEQFLQEAKQSGELPGIHRQLLQEKTMDFLVDKAAVTEVAPAASPETAPPA